MSEVEQKQDEAQEQDENALWDEFDREDSTAAVEAAPPDEGRVDDDEPLRNADAGADDNADDAPDGADQATADMWANASPAQKAAWQAAQEQIRKLEQAERSNRGRLSAFQRQINELREKAEQPPKPAAQEAADQGKPAPDGAGKEADGFLGSEEWSSFQDEYPEVAGPLSKVIGSLQARLERQDKELTAIGSERRTAALREQAAALEEEHPDWQTVAADPGFADWLHGQPRHIQEAAYRNANEIVDAAEAADVVGRFKAFRSEKTGNQARQNTAGNGAGPGNSRLAGKRQRQLESAAASRTRGPGVVSGIPEDGDEETIWRQFDEAERRQAGRA